jgi:hypothetical protein
MSTVELNNRLHTNAAVAFCFEAERRWRGVGEPNCWAIGTITHYEILLQRHPHGYGNRN